METKKSSHADLEGRRVQGFLLGLILVLALLFVALEWNSGDAGWSFFESDDDLEAEIELEPKSCAWWRTMWSWRQRCRKRL